MRLEMHRRNYGQEKEKCDVEEELIKEHKLHHLQIMIAMMMLMLMMMSVEKLFPHQGAAHPK